jgi:hypothetical protein
VGTEIFFGKSEKRLDSPVNKPPDGQISGWVTRLFIDRERAMTRSLPSRAPSRDAVASPAHGLPNFALKSAKA